MTDHKTLVMHREEVRVSEKELLKGILDLTSVCCVGFQDEPFPYIVPMNYGYVWEDKLTFYFHMAKEGHRLELLKRDPHVCVNVPVFLDRVGKKSYRNETHDYRSVTAFGTAEILDPAEQEEEYRYGFSLLCTHTGRPPIRKITAEMYRRLYILKITAEVVTGKAQYPIHSADEISIPPLQEK